MISATEETKYSNEIEHEGEVTILDGGIREAHPEVVIWEGLSIHLSRGLKDGGESSEDLGESVSQDEKTEWKYLGGNELHIFKEVQEVYEWEDRLGVRSEK